MRELLGTNISRYTCPSNPKALYSSIAAVQSPITMTSDCLRKLSSFEALYSLPPFRREGNGLLLVRIEEHHDGLTDTFHFPVPAYKLLTEGETGVADTGDGRLHNDLVVLGINAR